MISLLPIRAIILAIAVIYGGITCLFLYLNYNDSTTLYDAIKIALAFSAPLNLVILAFIYFGWKKIWERFPSLNRIIFPNLNGSWDMTIHWQWGEKSGTTQATAYIKQDLLKITMEVDAPCSDSETLMAKPKKDPESGRPILYYIYRSIPKNNKTLSNEEISYYEGAAILKFHHENNNRLDGNYFTNRSTMGRYELIRKK